MRLSHRGWLQRAEKTCRTRLFEKPAGKMSRCTAFLRGEGPLPRPRRKSRRSANGQIRSFRFAPIEVVAARETLTRNQTFRRAIQQDLCSPVKPRLISLGSHCACCRIGPRDLRLSAGSLHGERAFSHAFNESLCSNHLGRVSHHHKHACVKVTVPTWSTIGATMLPSSMSRSVSEMHCRRDIRQPASARLGHVN